MMLLASVDNYGDHAHIVSKRGIATRLNPTAERISAQHFRLSAAG